MNDKNIYEVVKFYQEYGKKARVIKRNLTLEQAQAICNDPETSSKTKLDLQSMTIQKNLDRKQRHWFYGYREMK